MQHQINYGDGGGGGGGDGGMGRASSTASAGYIKANHGHYRTTPFGGSSAIVSPRDVTCYLGLAARGAGADAH